jgi:4-amino-4-deoxy-L-arabinose transferase-like glycosyltransferase
MQSKEIVPSCGWLQEAQPSSSKQIVLSASKSQALVLGGFALYAAALVVYWPNVLLVSDESSYVRQARAFASGSITVAVKDPWTGQDERIQPSPYPPGTSALQAVFVRLGGWRAAVLASLISLLAVQLILMRWLSQQGYSQYWTILLLAYPPLICQARVAMSDVPSAAIVTLSLWLFWLGQRRNWKYSFVSGLFAGLSLLFRETNALAFTFFYLGAFVRRETRVVALTAGALLGICVRLLAQKILFGSFLFTRSIRYGWSLDHIQKNAPVYLVALLLMVPAGLIAVMAYKGPRRPELIATVFAELLFFMAYEYAADESSTLKRLVLAPRYFIPILPLIILAIADSAPRLWETIRRRLLNAAGLVRQSFPPGIALAAAFLVYAEVIAAHWYISSWAARQRAMVDTIYANTPNGGTIVHDEIATSKFINELYGPRTALDFRGVQPKDMSRLLQVNGTLQLALLYRSDSPFWQAASLDKDRFVATTNRLCKLDAIVDQSFSNSDRLRIWNVRSCQSP